MQKGEKNVHEIVKRLNRKHYEKSNLIRLQLNEDLESQNHQDNNNADNLSAESTDELDGISNRIKEEEPESVET